MMAVARGWQWQAVAGGRWLVIGGHGLALAMQLSAASQALQMKPMPGCPALWTTLNHAWRAAVHCPRPGAPDCADGSDESMEMCGRKAAEAAGAANTGGGSSPDQDEDDLLATVLVVAGCLVVLVLLGMFLRSSCAKQTPTVGTSSGGPPPAAEPVYGFRDTPAAPDPAAPDPAAEEAVQNFSISVVNRAFDPSRAAAGSGPADGEMYRDMAGPGGVPPGQAYAEIDEPAGRPAAGDYAVIDEGGVPAGQAYAEIDESAGAASGDQPLSASETQHDYESMSEEEI